MLTESHLRHSPQSESLPQPALSSLLLLLISNADGDESKERPPTNELNDTQASLPLESADTKALLTQSPQVLGTDEHGCLCSFVQLGALAQSTEFTADPSVDSTCFVESTLPTACSSWSSARVCSTLAVAAVAGGAVTRTVALSDALEPTESNTCTTQRTAKAESASPRGSIELPSADSDLDFTTRYDAAAEDGDTKPNSYDRGSDSEDQADATNTNVVFSSRPSDGSTEKPPGTGGPPVLMVTEQREAEAESTATAVSVKVSVVLVGSEFAASTKLVATVPPPAGMLVTGYTNDAVFRSTDAPLTVQEADPLLEAVTEPVSTSLAFTFTACDADSAESMLTDGADDATTTTLSEALLDLPPSVIVTVTVDELLAACTGAVSHLATEPAVASPPSHSSAHTLANAGLIWLQLHANAAPALPPPAWSSS